MYFDPIKLVGFCAKKKVTVSQFLFLYLHHTEQMSLFYRYTNEVSQFPKASIEDLEKRKIIINLNKQDDIHMDNVMIMPSYSDDLKVLLGEEADELFEAFPSQLSMGNMVFSGRTISPEDLELVYHKKLARSKSTHAEVMSALEEQKDNGTVGMGLKKWLETQQWQREDHSIDFSIDI